MKWHKNEMEQYSFLCLLEKLVDKIGGKFSSTAIVLDTFYVKYISVILEN